MFRAALICIALVLISGCASKPSSAVEDMTGSQKTSSFVLQSLRGTRDGERLTVRVVFGDGSGQLTVDMQFQVTPPTRLESGTWSGLDGSGGVRERSVTFLGGQNGPPSIGGNFELQAPDRKPLYRVQIPLQPLKETL